MGVSSMNKIDFILELNETEFLWEQYSLINALISALSRREAAALFNLEHDYSLRKATLRKISKDMNRGFQNYHGELVANLMSSFEGLSYNKKKAVLTP
jgi:hypothetical protein